METKVASIQTDFILMYSLEAAGTNILGFLFVFSFLLLIF